MTHIHNKRSSLMLDICKILINVSKISISPSRINPNKAPLLWDMCASVDPHVPWGVCNSPQEVTPCSQGTDPQMPPCWLCVSWRQWLGGPWPVATFGRVTPAPPAALSPSTTNFFILFAFLFIWNIFSRSLLIIPHLLFNLPNGCLPLYLDRFWANAISGSLHISLIHILTLIHVFSAAVIES